LTITLMFSEVDEHVQSATQKLEAVNRTQAVALALLRRIIEI
jgi:DNA-binding CsgD family transcriptional regulator